MPLSFLKSMLYRSLAGSWRPPRLAPTPLDPPANLRELGLYLHVPFCTSLCPFCPYNRQRYTTSAHEVFERAVNREIDRYAEMYRGCRITSLYVGGGTPTLDRPGFLRILSRIRERFPGGYPVAVELHPHVADAQALNDLLEAGVSQVSVGVQSLEDGELRRIGRNHSAADGRDALRNAVAARFASVNADLMFALPGQSEGSWHRTVNETLELGADEISTYPMMSFSYASPHGHRNGAACRPPERVLRRRLDLACRVAQQKGFQRSSVWTWTRPAKASFSSVTRTRYVGLGPGAASMTGSHFYVNTFSVDAYAERVASRLPIALAMQVPPRLDRAYWLYWSLYTLRVSREEFARSYPDRDLDREFGKALYAMQALGLLRRVPAGYEVTPAGAYWIHRIQNAYSLRYLERLWGACRNEAWPLGVSL